MLTLSGVNTYLGGTTVNTGTLAIASDANLGSGTVTLAGGVTLAVSGATTIDNAILLTGAATYGSAADQTLSGVISGPGVLIKTGAGTLTLTGAGTHVGGTAIDAGTLQIGNGGTTGSLAGNIVNNALLVFDRSNAITYSDAINGGGSLIKDGAGTLTLSGVNGYIGTTTIRDGALLVSGSITSPTLVQSGGLLGGAGIVGDVTVASGGTLAPGAGAGVLRAGDLAFATGSTFAVELGGAAAGQFDQARVTGAVALNGALTLQLIGGYSPGATTTFMIIENDGADAVAGTFTGLAEGSTISAGGASFTISYIGGTGNDVTLTYTAPSSGGGSEGPSNTPTEGADVITLPPEGGSVSAGGGNDTVTGGRGDDYIHGNQGNDSVTGGGGSDTMLGGQGDDFLHGNQGDDVLYGDKGDDSVAGGQGNDFLHGNQGDDVLLGDLGNDTVLGGQGNDVLQGGDGADYLSGDMGDDVLTGGAGADVFNFRGGQGRDIVTDFAQGDRIWLSASDAQDFQALGSKMTMAGADAVISLGSQTIVLIGVSTSSLTAQDFVFA